MTYNGTDLQDQRPEGTNAAGATTATPRAAVAAFLDALGRGTHEEALGWLSEDVRWQAPGDPAVVPWAGVWSGREEVRRFLNLLTSETETEDFGITELLPTGDRVFAVGWFDYRFPTWGGRFADSFVMEFEVDDGLIVSYRIHEDSYGLARAYRGEALAAG